MRMVSWWYQLALAVDVAVLLLLLALIYLIDPGVIPPSSIQGMHPFSFWFLYSFAHIKYLEDEVCLIL